jgi:hypothetical protein
MCTRCNIILWGAEKETPVFFKQIYHHSDGDLEGVGADIAALAVEMMGMDDTGILPSRFAKLLAEHSPSYEFEDDVHDPFPHGDIEWRYDMYFSQEGITVRCEHYTFDNDAETFEFSIKRTKRKK